MTKTNLKVEVLKKTIAKLVKAAPARKSDQPPHPLARLTRAFLEYDCDEARAELAAKKLESNVVDYNELRVTPAIELAALLGVRYPFADSRCSSLHRTLQSIFDREHMMNLDRLKEMKKPEIRTYLQGLNGISPYVEAAVALDCFDVPAAPVDTKFLLWLISKDALPPETDIKSAQHILEKHVKASEMADFFHGSRKELEEWAPKSWPAVAKVPSPVLAPPTEGSAPREESPAGETPRTGKTLPAKAPAAAPAKPVAKEAPITAKAAAASSNGKPAAKPAAKEDPKGKTAVVAAKKK